MPALPHLPALRRGKPYASLEQTQEEFATGAMLTFRVTKFCFEDLASLCEVKILEQLVKLFVHGLVLVVAGITRREVVVADVAERHGFDAVEVV